MEIINHECYVSFEVAKLLKEAGFDWECDYHYPNDNNLCHGFCNNDPMFKIIIAAPTLDVAQRWLREEKELNVNVDTWPAALWRWVVWKINPERRIVASEHSNYKTYEEAQEVGIKKALELILEKEE